MTRYLIAFLGILTVLGFYLFAVRPADEKPVVDLTRDQVEDIVRRSYQYVAMYNVNNKFAFDTTNPLSTGGWNELVLNTELADHTLQSIARPNNDTFDGFARSSSAMTGPLPATTKFSSGSRSATASTLSILL